MKRDTTKRDTVLERSRPARPEPRPSFSIKHLDLRSVTRDPDLFVCEIMLDTGYYGNEDDGKYHGPMRPWITCGRIKLQLPERRGASTAVLSARAQYGVTDFEHDSAYIFQIPIAGFEISLIDDGFVFADAVISGDAEGLRVPMAPGYDPTQLPGAHTCSYDRCAEKPHPCVPEGYFAGPYVTETFWRMLVGRKLDIRFGPKRKEEEASE